VALTFTPVEA